MELDAPEPHGTIHTWRDFLIHMATVCLGLLLAVVLGQMVEWLHHRHERHALEQRLLTEGRGDLASVENDFQYTDIYEDWIVRSIRDVDQANANGKPLVYRPMPRHYENPAGQPLLYDIPDSGEWEASKQSGLLTLLSEDEQSADYYRYEVMGNRITDRLNAFNDWLSALRAFLMRFSDPQASPIPDLSRITAEDRTEYRAMLSHGFELAAQTHASEINYAATVSAYLSGSDLPDEEVPCALVRTSREHPNRHPGLQDLILAPETASEAACR